MTPPPTATLRARGARRQRGGQGGACAGTSGRERLEGRFTAQETGEAGHDDAEGSVLRLDWCGKLERRCRDEARWRKEGERREEAPPPSLARKLDPVRLLCERRLA